MVKTKAKKKSVKKSTSKKIIISISHDGKIPTLLAHRLLEMSRDTPKELEVGFMFHIKNKEISNKNFIINAFLESDSDWLVMLDDNDLPPKDLLLMVKNAIDKKLNVVSPLCMALINENIITNLLKSINEDDKISFGMIPIPLEGEDKLVEVDLMDSSCMVIEKSVAEKMMNSFGKCFFTMLNKKGLISVGENLFFTLKLKELGYKLHVDCNYRMNSMRELDLFYFSRKCKEWYKEGQLEENANFKILIKDNLIVKDGKVNAIKDGVETISSILKEFEEVKNGEKNNKKS